jgi:nucleotide sugar dehydrogenase
MKVSIVGLGYIGTTIAGCVADRGIHVVGIDIDNDKVKKVNAGIPPISEPGLDKLFNLNSDKISASTNYNEIPDTDITFICVGTPSNHDGSVNLSYVFDAAKKIGRVLKKKKDYHLIVLRSTVPPGTSRKVIEIIEKESGKKC